MPSIRPSTWAGTPADHALGRLAEPLGPVRAHEVVVAADAAGGDDHRLRPELEVADDRARAGLPALDGARLEHSPRTPSTTPSVTVSR